jgi:hypothetical protein
VRIWDAVVDNAVAEALEYEGISVFSMAMVADGLRVFSCSCRWRVRVWDAAFGVMVGEAFGCTR